MYMRKYNVTIPDICPGYITSVIIIYMNKYVVDISLCRVKSIMYKSVLNGIEGGYQCWTCT